MLNKPTPPIAQKVAKSLVAHDHERIDPYYWMRDDERTDPTILAYLNAENAHTQAALSETTSFQTKLYDEIVSRIVKDESTVPYLDDGSWRYTRYEEGKEYPIHCRRLGTLEAAEEVVLDVNDLATGHDYYAAAGLAISPDGKTLAFAEDTVSRRLYTLRFRDLESGEFSETRIPNVSSSVVWAKDNKTIFYIVKESGTLREYQLWRHVLGTEPSSDQLIYEEADSEFSLWCSRTTSRQYVMIGSYQTVTHEVRVIDAGKPESDPIVLLERERGHEYGVDHAPGENGGRFYIRTNWDAKNFRLMSATLAETSDKSTWREEIGGRTDVFLETFEIFKDHLAVSERHRAKTRVRVIPWQAPGDAVEIEFDEEVFVVGFGVNLTIETDTVRLSYTSMTTPPSVIDFNMNTRDRELKKEQRVLGGFKKGDYTAKRLMVTARDGTEIPVSLVYRRDLDRSVPQPVLQYAYGSYGISTDPSFSSIRVSLLDRGFVWAIAHVRGGQENGRPWYEDGKLLNKQNTFTDFVDVTAHLIETGWTSAEQTFAFGGSAGGLLMGAIANMRPELYRGIVASVPFVDVVTTMLDETIPLTTYEYDEWGNPNDKAYYETMLAYSPYDNISEQPYPSMFIIAGLHDSQVQYWEPAKWVAKLRDQKTDDNLLLLHTNMEAGHGGASGRFRRHKETAMWFAFLLELAARGAS